VDVYASEQAQDRAADAADGVEWKVDVRRRFGSAYRCRGVRQQGMQCHRAAAALTEP
jgi:hypothetical protein